MKFLKQSVCFLLFIVSAFAQGDRGSITGTVSDSTRAVVPNAAVSLRNTETGSLYKTVTTETGNYTLPQLPSGIYELGVEAAGFSRYVQTGIHVAVAQAARANVVLQVGSTSESVTVSADAPLLRTEGAEQSTNIRTELIDSLPYNFGARGLVLRNPLNIVQVIPGATITGRDSIRVNGSPAATFGALLEGQDLTMPMGPENSDMVAPSVEAIQEIAVQTSNYAAEYGQASGGLFNMTTKSGSNGFHGGGYEYLVNEIFDAGLPYSNNGQGEHVRTRERKHDWGATLGGPVLIPKIYNGKDRTFFFFNFEKNINRFQYSGTYTTVPTADFRNGNFGAILTGKSLATDPLGRSIPENTIYDPNTTRVLQNGARVRDPFQGNIIPLDHLDPIAKKIQSYIPLPTRAGQTNNFEQVYKTHRLNQLTSVKIDHSFSPSSKLSFYEHYFVGTYANNSADGMPVPITNLRAGGCTTNTIRISYDHSVTPTLLVHAGAGLLRENVPDQAVDGVMNFDSVKELGLIGAIGLGFPRITGLGGSLGGMSISPGPTNGQVYYDDKPSGTLSATMVRNNHTFKAGADWHRDTYAKKNWENRWGTYNFSSQQTTLPSTQGQNLSGGSVGYAYASFLLGLVSSSSITNQSDPQYRKDAWDMYVQDTWKVTKRFTLDYGLRWDYFTTMRELWYRVAAFDPNRANPSAGNLLGATSYEGYGPGRCNCRFAPGYPYAIGPRIGAAYQVTSKTVFRAGFGISYGRTADFSWLGPSSGVGYNTLNFDSPSYGDPAVTFSDGMRYSLSELYAADYNPGIRPRPGQIDSPEGLVDRNAGRPPRIAQWSVGFQREIVRNLVVEASYVGNRGAWYQANGLVALNALSGERLRSFGLDIHNAADRTLLTSRLDSPTAASRGFNKAPYAGYPMSNTVAQSLRPYPQFGNLSTRQAPLGRNWYDALHVKATKRLSSGLEFTSAFSWQKELSMMGSGINDVFNRANQKYLDSSSQPFVFVASFNYHTPKVGPYRSMRAVVGDWVFSGIVRYSSGSLIGVPSSNNQLSSLLFGGTRMNRVPGEPLFTKDVNCKSCFDPRTDFVLNPKAWSDAPAGEWGYSAAYYNDYRWSRRPDEQLSFGRTFRIREAMSFHVRLELFNAFNRLVVPNPTSGNPQATQTCISGTVSNGICEAGTRSGYGYINTASVTGQRSGQLVMRFDF